MTKTCCILCAAIIGLTLPGCGPRTTGQPPCDVRIAWEYDTYLEIPEIRVANKDFTETELHYPRVKRLSDGSLMLTFSNHHYGWNIYVAHSLDDGKTWGPAQMVRQQFPSTSSIGKDTTVFVNPDFIELQDGRILLAYQWRYKGGYGDIPNTNDNCGIEVMFSDDKGRTFGAPREIFRARCWEPAMLQLPSGEIQMYITSSQDVVDGVSYPRTIVIRSFDGGQTWQGKACASINDVEPISRSIDERFAYDGMPSGVWLDNNNGIAVPLESWHGRLVVDQTPIVVKTSVEANWRTDYDKILNEGGPDYPLKKQVNKDFWAYGPYSAKLSSGEVVILANGTYKGEQGIWTLIGDDKADNFRFATTPFDGHWGSIADIGNDRVLATGTVNYTDQKGAKRTRIVLMKGRVNRSKRLIKGEGLEMPRLAAFDPANSSWWYLGKKTPSYILTDFAYTDHELIVKTCLFDHSISSFTTENSDASIVLLSRSTPAGPVNYKIAVNAAGDCRIYREERFSWHLIDKRPADDIEVSGTINDDSDIDLGFAARIAIDWDLIGGKPSRGEELRAQLRHCYKMRSSEKPLSILEYADGESSDYPSEWLRLTLN